MSRAGWCSLALSAAALAACADGRGVLEITIDSGAPVAGIAAFHVTLAASGRTSGPYLIAVSGSPIGIPPQQKLSLDFDAKARGPLTVALDALDGAGNVLASGQADTRVEPSRLTRVTVLLGAAALPDLGSDDAGADAGNTDFAGPPPDVAAGGGELAVAADLASDGNPAADVASALDLLSVPDLVSALDLVSPVDALPDQAVRDLTPPDLSLSDLALPDFAQRDLALPDFALPDLALPDLVACGRLGLPCCMGMTCSDGSKCILGNTTTRCAVFGGTYELTTPGGAVSCANGCQPRSGNLLTGGACACPPGFASQQAQINNDCNARYDGYGTLAACSSGSVVAGSDWRGMYLDDEAGNACSLPSCGRSTNPQNGNACGCPAGSEDVMFPIVAPQNGANCLSPNFTLLLGVATNLHVCLGQNVPAVTLAGAYQVDINDCSGNAMLCRRWSSKAANCQCPGASQPSYVRVDDLCAGTANMNGTVYHPAVGSFVVFCVVPVP